MPGVPLFSPRQVGPLPLWGRVAFTALRKQQTAPWRLRKETGQKNKTKRRELPLLHRGPARPRRHAAPAEGCFPSLSRTALSGGFFPAPPRLLTRSKTKRGPPPLFPLPFTFFFFTRPAPSPKPRETAAPVLAAFGRRRLRAAKAPRGGGRKKWLGLRSLEGGALVLWRRCEESRRGSPRKHAGCEGNRPLSFRRRRFFLFC